MAETNERVMEMVREELGKNPDASVTELQDKAQKIDASMGKLTTRQFHARYPLQVKRKQGGGKRRKAAKKRAGRKSAGGATATKATAKKATAKKAGGKRRGRPRKNAAAGSTASASSSGGRSGGAVKDVLVDFAGKIAGADTKSLIRIMGDLDSWVARIEKAAG